MTILHISGKALLMLRSVKKAKLLLEQQSKSDPRMHGCIVRFQKFVTDKMSTFGDAVQKVLMNETKKQMHSRLNQCYQFSTYVTKDHD